MSSPPRPPADVAAAEAALARPGACCGHAYGAHAPDGCRICQLLQGRLGVEPCTGWRPADLTGSPASAVILDDPTGNAHQFGIEDTDALTCSTDDCGHRADHHQEQPVQATGLGACTVDGCDCFAWTYVIADDVVDAEVLDPVGDAIRAVLEPYVGATWTADSAAAATIALVSTLEEHADDVADYLRLPRAAGGDLNGDRLHAIARAIAVATDRYNGEGTAILAELARDGWRLERTARGVQVG